MDEIAMQDSDLEIRSSGHVLKNLLEKHPRFCTKSIFLVLGVGVLVPWNTFISAKAYFESRFCLESKVIGSLEPTFAFIYNCAAVLSLGCILIGRLIHEKKSRSSVDEGERLNMSSDSRQSAHEMQDDYVDRNSSARLFVVFPLTLLVLIFLTQSSFVLVVDWFSPMTMLSLTLLCIAASGVASAMATAGVVAAAAQFEKPELAMSPFLTGQSIGGLLIAFANLAEASTESPRDFWDSNCDANNSTLAISPVRHMDMTNEQGCSPYRQISWGTLAYFLLGLVIFVLCLVGFSCIEKLLECIDIGEPDGIHRMQDEDFESVQALRPSGEGLDTAAVKFDSSDTDSPTRSDQTSLDNSSDESGRLDSPLQVLRVVRGPTAAIFTTLSVTLSLFPTWTTELRSASRCIYDFRLSNDLYTPATFVLFNIGDVLGRLLSGVPSLRQIVSPYLVAASMARFLFFPLLFVCPSLRGNSMHVESDLFSYSVQLLFAMSNGFVLTSAFAKAPSLLPRSQDDVAEQRMSEILSFAVSFGLFVGSLCSLFVTKF